MESEKLLVAAETSDAYPVQVINASTGVAVWSYKGGELHGAVSGCVERLGADGQFLAVAAKDKPVLHMFSLESRKRSHVKSALPKPAEHLEVSIDGSLLFVAADTTIAVWMVKSGDLITVFEGQYRRITAMALSVDGALLVCGSEDGTLRAFFTADILSVEHTDADRVEPFREWRPHSLKVSGISVALFSNTRVLSCSKDHSAAFYSMATDECILKVSSGAAFSACSMDPGECRLFLGTERGWIGQINLYSLEESELNVDLRPNDDRGQLPFYTKHSAEVSRLLVNQDGSILASGDVLGNCFIWDIHSQQCLKKFSLKGRICKLRFFAKWDSPPEVARAQMYPLKPQPTARSQMQFPLLPKASSQPRASSDQNAWSVSHLNGLIEAMLAQSDAAAVLQKLNDYKQSDGDDSPGGSKSESSASTEAAVKSLMEENKTLRRVNNELYDFAASVVQKGMS